MEVGDWSAIYQYIRTILNFEFLCFKLKPGTFLKMCNFFTRIVCFCMKTLELCAGFIKGMNDKRSMKMRSFFLIELLKPPNVG